MTKTVYLAGAKDPEMERAIDILTKQGKTVIQAKKGGVPVHAANAYEADNEDDIPTGTKVIFMECGFLIKRFDHHRPGDPGYGKGPSLYWEASSIGQVYEHLGLPRPPNGHRDLILAAMDHCYNAAMKGECPGVTTEEVLQVKLEEIAKATKKTIEEVSASVQKFREKIYWSPTFNIGSEKIHDLRENTGIGYSLPYLTAQVAAVLEKVPVIIRLHDKEGETTERHHLCGDISEETLEYFMKTWGPKNGYTKIYGSPSRGYAGGTK